MQRRNFFMFPMRKQLSLNRWEEMAIVFSVEVCIHLESVEATAISS
jgi:hypothetical protein